MLISKEFIRYSVVGMINTLVGIGSSLIFLNFFGLSFWASTAMGYTLGIAVSYTLNKRYTFSDKSKKITSQFIKFITLMVSNYFISNWLAFNLAPKFFEIKFLSGLIHLVNDSFFHIASKTLVHNVAVFTGMVIYFFIGFFGSKILVFKRK